MPPTISCLSLASGSQSHLCWYCDHGEETLPTKLQKCGRCGLAEYCNRECQRVDWELNKAKCKRLTEIVVEKDAKLAAGLDVVIDRPPSPSYEYGQRRCAEVIMSSWIGESGGEGRGNERREIVGDV